MAGTLYLVPVPIGNAADITLRAVETLRTVDLVAAEDTRHFATLARVHGLSARSLSFHEHNEQARVQELLGLMHDGASVAVVSDAGTPVLSDPGYRLVLAALDAGMHVESLPGASAVTTALAASGLPPVPFRFCGFPPRTSARRTRFFAALADEPGTLVCFEAPHRMLDSLRDAHAALGDREACLARNLTKPHERWERGMLGDLIEALQPEHPVRGECTLLIAGAGTDKQPGVAGLTRDADAAARAANLLLREGAPPRAVTALLTEIFALPRRRAYRLAHPRAGVE